MGAAPPLLRESEDPTRGSASPAETRRGTAAQSLRCHSGRDTLHRAACIGTRSRDRCRCLMKFCPKCRAVLPDPSQFMHVPSMSQMSSHPLQKLLSVASYSKHCTGRYHTAHHPLLPGRS
eukprot:Polyplicarium_translucidae@DN3236_c0_g1_i10.p1